MIVLDTSTILAILLEEEEAASFGDRNALRQRLEAASGERIAALEAIEPERGRAESRNPSTAGSMKAARRNRASGYRNRRRPASSPKSGWKGGFDAECFADCQVTGNASSSWHDRIVQALRPQGAL